MFCLVAFDLVLWIVRAGVVSVPFIIHVFTMHTCDATGHPPRFRVPAHVIADLEHFFHDANALLPRDDVRDLLIVWVDDQQAIIIKQCILVTQEHRHLV